MRTLVSIPDAIRIVGRRRARVLDISAASELVRGGFPNAVQCPMTDLKGADGGPIPPPVFAQLAAHLGVYSATPVIICSNSVVLAARFWYISQLYGKAGVQVLDGTAKELLAARAAGVHEEGGLIQHDDHEEEENMGVRFVPVTAHKLLANAAEVLQAISAGDPQIIDARTPGEFSAAHIPSALNLPHAALLTLDGKFKDERSLHSAIDAAGVRSDRASIVYCGVGLRASAVVLGLNLISPNMPLAANYDGSMNDWLRRGHAITQN